MSFKFLLIIFVLLSLSFYTYNRNEIWEDEITLWSHTLRLSPLKLRPIFNLARSYQRKNDLQMAEYYYLRAAHLFPENPDIYNNLGNVYKEQGLIEKAIDFYLTGLSFGKTNPLHYNLAGALEEKGDLQGALYHYSEALRLDPSDEVSREKLAEIFSKFSHDEK